MPSDPRPLSLEDFRENYMNVSRRRSDAIQVYGEALRTAAEAKFALRKAKSIAYVTAAAEGGTAEQKKVRADELAAEAERKMELAIAQAKVAKEHIDANEADRSMLRADFDRSNELHGRGIE